MSSQGFPVLPLWQQADGQNQPTEKKLPVIAAADNYYVRSDNSLWSWSESGGEYTHTYIRRLGYTPTRLLHHGYYLSSGDQIRRLGDDMQVATANYAWFMNTIDQNVLTNPSATYYLHDAGAPSYAIPPAVSRGNGERYTVNSLCIGGYNCMLFNSAGRQAWYNLMLQSGGLYQAGRAWAEAGGFTAPALISGSSLFTASNYFIDSVSDGTYRANLLSNNSTVVVSTLVSHALSNTVLVPPPTTVYNYYGYSWQGVTGADPGGVVTCFYSASPYKYLSIQAGSLLVYTGSAFGSGPYTSNAVL